MEGGRHRRSKSAPSFEGIFPIQKIKAFSRSSPNNSSHDNGSSSARMFMVERGESSSSGAIERPMATYLAEKMFKEVKPKSSSSSGMARLRRLERLNSLWNTKQKMKLPEGHHHDNVLMNIKPDRQPRGCLLYNRRKPTKKQQFNQVYDEPDSSHFVNHCRSSEWSASSMPTQSELGLTRQKIDANHFSTGELIGEKPVDSKVYRHSKAILMNCARNLDSVNANKRASSSSSLPERRDDLLLESHNRCGVHTSHRISNTQQVDKKKKDIFPRPILFPRSNIRSIPTVEESCSSSYHSRINIPNFRIMREHPGVGAGEEASWRTNVSCHDVKVSEQISDASRKLAKEFTRQLREAMVESEDEMYPKSKGIMGNEFKLSSRYLYVDDIRGRHFFSGPNNGEGNNRVLETLKITRTYRDLEQDDDASILREVIAIPNKEIRNGNFPHNERSGARLGTDSRSTIFGGPSRSRSLPPIMSKVHRRDTCLDVMQNDPMSCGRSWDIERFPIHNNFLASQGSSSRGKMSILFPPIRIREVGSSLEATFEMPMESNLGDFSEQQLAETDGDSGDNVYDIMVDKQEISTLPSEHSTSHPRHSSEDNESSASDDEDNFNVQGLHDIPLEEGSPSLNSLEVETRFSESSNNADYGIPPSDFEIPYVEDASSISETFESFNTGLNELCTKLQLPKLDSREDAAYPSSSAESWKYSYMIDVLIQSSFQEFSFDMLLTIWHSPDYPLNPALFDTLEMKYGEELPELKSERMLLFDRINSALSEIFQKRVDLHPWLMPKLRLLSTRAKEPPIEKLINQKSTNKQLIERILLRDMQWVDLVEEFTSMGTKIEELLLDDMITEFVCDISSLMDVFYYIA